MISFLWGLLGFAITIGILVTIHEWGHFAMARYFDVKILRFSLGFGKPFISWTGKKDGTKYTIAPIPLGGFVQMYGESSKEEEKGEISEADRHRTFAAKTPWQRFLIAFAGPFVNLVFAVIAFAMIFMVGVDGVRPNILYVAPNSLAAKAGLQAGDELLSVDGTKLSLSTDADIALVAADRKPITITYLRQGKAETTMLDLSGLKAGDELRMDSAIGMVMVDGWYPAKVAEVVKGSPAEKMGIHSGDRIVSINGTDVGDGSGVYIVSDVIRPLKDAPAEIVVMRDGQTVTLHGSFGNHQLKNGDNVGYLGVRWAYEKPSEAFFDQYGITQRYGLFSALKQGAYKTAYYVKLTFEMFGRLIQHKVSFDNMGGPLTIGDMAGRTLQLGGNVFLNFLGVVSLSLAAINLLPIPMLDGGHMLFCVVEAIRGKPLKEKTTEWFYRIGATIVMSFMGLIILNDIFRYVFKTNIFDWVSGLF